MGRGSSNLVISGQLPMENDLKWYRSISAKRVWARDEQSRPGTGTKFFFFDRDRDRDRDQK
jgi:hypothetical protein